MSNRREFMMQVGLGGGVVLAGNAMAQAAMVAETDPQAAALGYKADASKVDKAKFPKFATGQVCTNCQLYVAKSANAGACAIFPGKLVAGPGWCNAWVKKA